MTPAAIIQKVTEDGVTLTATPSGSIKASGDSVAVSRWLPVIRENKPNILAALQDAEKALARLQREPNVRYALATANLNEDQVLVTVYIRDANQAIKTCDLILPRMKYNPILLEELIKQHSGTIH